MNATDQPDVAAEPAPAEHPAPVGAEVDESAVTVADPEPTGGAEPVAASESDVAASESAEDEELTAPEAVATLAEPEADARPEAEPQAEEKPKPAKKPRKAKAKADSEPEPEAAAAEPAATDGEAAPAEGEAAPPSAKKWYVIKVASNREESIKAAIERRVKIDGLEPFFGQIVIPVERVTEMKKVKETKNGEKITKEKRVIKERKKFPGYLMAEVEFSPDILTLFRDTNGVGDFVGATGPGKPPPPMSDLDVQRMLYGMMPGGAGDAGKGKMDVTKIKLDFEVGDKVRIRDGAFANYEGEVKLITPTKEAGETPMVKVEVQVLGRPVPLDLEYFKVDKI